MYFLQTKILILMVNMISLVLAIAKTPRNSGTHTYNTHRIKVNVEVIHQPLASPISPSIVVKTYDSTSKIISKDSQFVSLLKSYADGKFPLQSKDKKQLLAFLRVKIPTVVNSSDLAMIVWSVGKLKLAQLCDDRGVIIFNLLIENLIRHRSTLSEEDMSVLLIGFVRIGLPFLNEASLSLLDALPRTMRIMDSQQVANTVWALGKLGVSWDSLSLRQRKAVLESITTCFSRRMTAQGLANIIQGLSLMKAQWKNLPINLTTSLFSTLKTLSKVMNEQEVSNCISGLGRLGAKWGNIPQDIKDAVNEGFLRTQADMPAQGVVMFVHGLGHMEADINSLHHSLRNQIITSISKTAGDMNAQEVANILYGLGKMNATFSYQSPVEKVGGFKGKVKTFLSKKCKQAVSDALLRELRHMNSQGIANSLWGLMLMEAQWMHFDIAIKSEILRALSREARSMNEQELANSLYALGKMDVHWTDLSESVRVKMLAGLEEQGAFMTSAGIVMTLLGLGRMQLHWNILPYIVRSTLSTALSRILRQAGTDDDVSILLHAISSVQAKWDELNPGLQATIQESIARSHWDLHLKNRDQLSSTNNPIKNNRQEKETSTENEELCNKVKVKRQKREANIVAASYSIDPDLHMLMAPPKTKQIGVPSYVSARNVTAVPSDVMGNLQPQNLIFSLGKIGARWDDLGFSARSTLFNSLEESVGDMDEKAVVNMLQGFASMGSKWPDFRSNIRSEIFKSLLRISNDLGEIGIANVILSLAKLEVCWQTDLPDDLKSSLRKAIARQSHIGEHALSSLLYGLGKLSREWADLHPDVRQALKAAIVVCHVNNKLTSRGVTNSLYGLGQMKADWNGLSSSVRLALLTDVSNILDVVSETQLSNILYSLGKMGVSWNALPQDLRDRLLKSVEAKASAMNEQNISNVFFAFGTLGLNWFDMPTSLRDILLQRLESITGHIDLEFESKPVDNEDVTFESTLTVECGLTGCTVGLIPMQVQGLCMSLVGLSNCGFKKAFITNSRSNLEFNLETSMKHMLPLMNPAQFASTLSGLAKMSWRWDSMDRSFKSIIHGVVSDVCSKAATSLQDISVIVNSLGSLGVSWTTIPAETRKHLLKAINRIFVYGNAQELSGAIFGIALMDCALSKMPGHFRSSLINGIKRITSRQLSAGSEIYSKKTAPYRVDSEHLLASSEQNPSVITLPRSKSSFSINNKGLGLIQMDPFVLCSHTAANMVYGLSLLVFDACEKSIHNELMPCHIALLDSISRIGIGRFSDVEREQVLIYIHLLQSSPAGCGADFHHPTSRNLILRADQSISSTSHHTISKLQKSVTNALCSALKKRCDDDLDVAVEYSGFGGVFPVDCTVFEGDEPVAFVEVDGPQHFRDGMRLRRKDLMKESFYRFKYPTAAFTRINFDQVDKLGSNFVGDEVANYVAILRSHHETSRRNVEDFLSGVSTGNVPFDLYSSSSAVGNIDMDGFVLRSAERALKSALAGKKQENKSILDFVFADNEEDNS